MGCTSVPQGLWATPRQASSYIALIVQRSFVFLRQRRRTRMWARAHGKKMFPDEEHEDAEFLLRSYLDCRLHTSTIAFEARGRRATPILDSHQWSLSSFWKQDAAPEVPHYRILSDESRTTRARRSSSIAACGSFMPRGTSKRPRRFRRVCSEQPKHVHSLGSPWSQKVSGYDR